MLAEGEWVVWLVVAFIVLTLIGAAANARYQGKTNQAMQDMNERQKRRDER